MDATIAAALISGGVGALGIVGTVVTSVVGSRNTRRATEQAIEAGAATTRATLVAAREDALWGRRAAAYEETLAGLLHRQAKRQFDMRDYQMPPDAEKQMDEFYKSHEPPGLFDAEGRLVAYASDPVLTGFKLARGAHAAVWVARGHRDALLKTRKQAKESNLPEGIPDAEIMTDGERKLNSALQDAGDRDDALIDIIREELRSRPEAALQPLTPLSAVRRKFRLLHRDLYR